MSNDQKAIEGAEPLSQNISFEELLAQRMETANEPEETEETEESEEPETEEVESDEDQAEEVEETEEETESDETEEPEAEDIDLLSLSPAQIQELAKKGKSRLLHRIGELTAQKHALEERLNTLPDAKPLLDIPQENNPFKDLKTVEEIRAKHAEFLKVAEETDRILEDHEEYASDDIITLGDKEFTKKQIRLANRNARDAMLKFLPAQHAELVRIEQRTQMAAAYDAAIPKEVPEVADEESDIGKQFKAMLSDPLVEQVRQRVPDLAPQLGYLLAHAVASIHRSQKLKTRQPAQGPPPRPKVSGSPVGAGAARSGVKASKGSDQMKKFEETGSVEDWIAARSAKLQNR